MNPLQLFQVMGEILSMASVSALGPVFRKDDVALLRFRSMLLSQASRRILGILRVRVESDPFPTHGTTTGRLIVANHVSFLDILVIAASRPALFVTSVEKKEIPGVGALAELGGTLFVERRHKRQVKRDQESISLRLSQGFDVVLFPEGTSGDGKNVLPFKRGLFPSALKIGAEILPLAIDYVAVKNRPLSEIVRDQIFFYSDIGILTHLKRLFSLHDIRCRLHVLPAVSLKPDASRREVDDFVERIREDISRKIIHMSKKPETKTSPGPKRNPGSSKALDRGSPLCST